MVKKKTKNILELRNANWYENGRYLPKRDYIFHSSSDEGESIISCRTGQKYTLRNFSGVAIGY